MYEIDIQLIFVFQVEIKKLQEMSRMQQELLKLQMQDLSKRFPIKQVSHVHRCSHVQVYNLQKECDLCGIHWPPQSVRFFMIRELFNVIWFESPDFFIFIVFLGCLGRFASIWHFIINS